MAEAANRFLRSLDEGQRAKVSIDFGGEKRTFWHYIPGSMLESQGGRRGLPIKEMSPEQRMLAHGLVNTALSHPGYLQAMTVMMLESVLRDLESLRNQKGGGLTRDPELYHLAIHGDPSTTKTWGWSFEGHYYRIQTPHYLFEYDNTQNGANHIHAVWRQFDGDFGEDLLSRHYQTSPHHQQARVHDQPTPAPM
jgi:hypothetical protein